MESTKDRPQVIGSVLTATNDSIEKEQESGQPFGTKISQQFQGCTEIETLHTKAVQDLAPKTFQKSAANNYETQQPPRPVQKLRKADFGRF